MPVDAETEKSSACAHRGIGPPPHPRVSQQRCLGDDARTVRPWWPWPASCSPRSLCVPLGPIVSFARSPETLEVPANEAHCLGQQNASLLSCPVGLAKRGPGRCMDESPWKAGLNPTPHLGQMSRSTEDLKKHTRTPGQTEQLVRSWWSALEGLV